MSGCNNGLPNCITPLPMDASGKMSDYEFLCWIQTNMTNLLKEYGELSAAWKALQEWVTNYFDNLDVQQEINNKINDMIQSGEMDKIINDNLFSSLDARIASNKQDIDNLSDTAITNTSTDYVGMGQLTQEVKEALTGGSTPVVGTNAVGTSNIVDYAVTLNKVDGSMIYPCLNINGNARINLNTIANTITFVSGTGFVMGYGNQIVNFEEPVVLNFDGSSQMFIKYVHETGIIKLSNLSMVDGESLIGFINEEWNIGLTSEIPVYLNGHLKDGSICINPSLGNVINVNTTYNVLTFYNPNGYVILYNNAYITLNTSQISLSNGDNNLYYNSISNIISSSGDKYVGNVYYNTTTKVIYFNLINDVPYSINGNTLCENLYNGMACINVGQVVFDFVSGVISFPSSMILKVNGKRINVTNQPDLKCANEQWGAIMYNTATNAFELSYDSSNINPFMIICGYAFPLRNIGAFYYNDYRIITQGDASNYCNRPAIAMFGDSITAGAGAAYPYCFYLSIKGKVTVLNYGVGGACYSISRPTTLEGYVGQGDTNRGTHMNLPENNNFPAYITSKINSITTDTIGIMGGTNDFGLNVDIDTFTQNVNSAIDVILSNGKLPIIFSPCPRVQQTNTLNLHLLDYVNAIKSCCENYNVPFVDMYHGIGFYPTNSANYAKFFNDDIHPNNNGHMILGAMVQEAYFKHRGC